ncbi:MAG: hypothetical protein Barrevirus31_1, partial [Barrevirus sp.]
CPKPGCPPLLPPTNKTIFEVNNIKNTDSPNFFWLYSSNYGNTSWCYKKDISDQIEKIYKDYMLRKGLHVTGVPIITFKPVKYTKVSKNSVTTSKNSDEEFEELELSSDSSDIEFADTTPAQKSPVSTPVIPLSYNIKVSNGDYKMDFDLMKQVNLLDPQKQRNVKRIELPQNMMNKTVNEIIQFLTMNCQVIGISGKKF